MGCLFAKRRSPSAIADTAARAGIREHLCLVKVGYVQLSHAPTSNDVRQEKLIALLTATLMAIKGRDGISD